MSNWHAEIQPRDSYRSKAKFIVVGWYEDEKSAYKLAEQAWDKKSRECWEKNNPPVVGFPASNDLDLTDDYFSWNVTTPSWLLHKDGTWHKSLCRLESAGKGFRWYQDLLPGEYKTREEAERILQNSSKPERFENYQEHLDSAAPPVSCKES